MSIVDIILERETANDENALVVQIYAPSGTAVVEDELIFDIENSKATQEFRAPTAGCLEHDLAVGQLVPFGEAIARIRTNDVAADPQSGAGSADGGHRAGAPGATTVDVSAAINTPSARTTVEAAIRKAGDPTVIEPERHENAGVASPIPASGQPVAPPRFSKAAAALMAQFGIDASTFETGFVTTAQVHARATADGTAATRIADVLPAAADPRAQSPAFEPIGSRKKAEIDALVAGAGATMLSVLGTHVGHLKVHRAAGAFMTDRITDLVIYEASRLMRKFPRLNAGYAEQRVALHAAVHAGIAIDEGGRLVVYGIEHADRAGMAELADRIADAAARYLSNQLTASELTRATFTITDLSASELDFVLPLLPRGQSCILGITSNARDGFRIHAGFDHRVTEGREVALFLDELRGRLLSYGSAAQEQSPAAACAYCGRSAAEAVSRVKDKGLLKIIDNAGREALCCAGCWNGW